LVLVALANFMRLSLLKAAHAVVSSAAWQEIRVRSGRDDNVAWKQCLAFPNKIVISTGGVMGLRPTQGNEKRLGPASTLYEPLPFPCHPDRSEPGFPATLC
jgi:hypothetical protein